MFTKSCGERFISNLFDGVIVSLSLSSTLLNFLTEDLYGFILSIKYLRATYDYLKN